MQQIDTQSFEDRATELPITFEIDETIEDMDALDETFSEEPIEKLFGLEV